MEKGHKRAESPIEHVDIVSCTRGKAKNGSSWYTHRECNNTNVFCHVHLLGFWHFYRGDRKCGALCLFPPLVFSLFIDGSSVKIGAKSGEGGGTPSTLHNKRWSVLVAKREGGKHSHKNLSNGYSAP